MAPFLLYQLKAGFCILLFTVLYYVLFRRETFHRFNRFYLTGSMLLAFVIPAIRLPGLSAESKGITTRIIGAVSVYAGRVVPDNAPEFKAGSVILGIYLGIAILFTVYLLLQLIHLVIKVSRSEMTLWGEYRIIFLPEKKHSFSFFNLIFLGLPAAHTSNNNQVLQHELVHARQWHSLDILLLQLIKIFQWFNPFVYLAEKALQETHEYLADAAVVEQNSQTDRYKLLLLTQVFGVQPGIFSFFNQSLLKNRLTMMTKEKSPPRNRLKYLAALPLILIMGLVMCCKLNNPDEMPPPPPPPPPPPAEITPAEDEPALVFVEEQAAFQEGDTNDFREWVQKNLTYPPEAVKAGIFGRVTVQFTVNSAGKIGDIKIIRGVSPMLDKEAIRVLETSPDWIPAKTGGKNVKQQFVIPVVFTLE